MGWEFGFVHPTNPRRCSCSHCANLNGAKNAGILAAQIIGAS